MGLGGNNWPTVLRGPAWRLLGFLVKARQIRPAHGKKATAEMVFQAREREIWRGGGGFYKTIGRLSPVGPSMIAPTAGLSGPSLITNWARGPCCNYGWQWGLGWVILWLIFFTSRPEKHPRMFRTAETAEYIRGRPEKTFPPAKSKTSSGPHQSYKIPWKAERKFSGGALDLPRFLGPISPNWGETLGLSGLPALY
jgi:hypothetical protein